MWYMERSSNKTMFMTCLAGWMFLLTTVMAGAQDKRVFMIAGQSNAVGQGDAVASVVCAPGVAFEYTASGLKPLRDPAGTAADGFEHAKSGSLCPAFVNAYNQLTGRVVILVPAARGGSSCHQKAELDMYGTWARTGRQLLFDRAVRKAQAAVQEAGIPLSGIIWLQGERDANAINDGKLSAAEYREALEDLLHRFRAVFGAALPVYIVQTGYYHQRATHGFDQVRAAQEAVTCNNPYTYIVYRKTNLFQQKNWMKDDIHYNQAGLNDIGAAVAEEVAALESVINK